MIVWIKKMLSSDPTVSSGRVLSMLIGIIFVGCYGVFALFGTIMPDVPTGWKELLMAIITMNVAKNYVEKK